MIGEKIDGKWKDIDKTMFFFRYVRSAGAIVFRFAFVTFPI